MKPTQKQIVEAALKLCIDVASQYQTATPLKEALARLKPEEVLKQMRKKT